MYMQAIFLGESGDGYKTGIGAIFDTPEKYRKPPEAIAAIAKRRRELEAKKVIARTGTL